MNQPGSSLQMDQVPSSIPVQTETGLRLSALNPKYLHTNSTSHTWPFSAIAELVDNAYDPDVKASQLYIDLKSYGGLLAMTFTDNGNGMTPDKLYKMLSFGFCEKVTVKGHMPVGHYGNGFKSGSMRLGKDALVFTVSDRTKSLGYLSQTYLRQVNADTIIVPIVTWDKISSEILDENEKKKSLPVILRYSVLDTIREIEKEFSYIEKTGTRIIITNLRSTEDKTNEFDIKTDKTDIRIPDDIIDSAGSKYKREERQNHIPASDYSLRAYLSILYLKPRMQIFLRKEKVKTVVIRKSLSKTEVDLYKPIKYKQIKIVFGFSQNINHYGIMMYHRNRLIKPYVRVGCQLKPNNNGVGVIGVIECNSLQPTHNKQDFDYTPLYRSTMAALGHKLNDYWNEKCGYTNNTADGMNITKPDELWVQCDICLKWRKLPDYIKKEDLPEKWYCHMHPDPAWKSCEVPEEEEEPVDNVRPYEKKLKRIEKEIRQKETEKIQQNNFDIDLERRRREKAEYEKQQKQDEVTRLSREVEHLKGTFHMGKAGSSSSSLQTGRCLAPNKHKHQIQPSYTTPLRNTESQNLTANSSANNPQQVTTTEIKQENGPNVHARLIARSSELASSDNTRGTKKRPITLDSDDDDDDENKQETGSKVVKLENGENENSFALPETSTFHITSTQDAAMLNENTMLNNTSTVCSNSTNISSSIKDRVFKISTQQLKDIDPDIIEDLKKQSVSTLGLTLAKRSQALRNLKKKVLKLIKSLVADDLTLPDTSAQDIDDGSIEELLNTVIDINVVEEEADDEN